MELDHPRCILMGRAFLFLIPLLMFLTRAEAIDLSATGGWNETVDESDLASGAGSNLIDAYESTTGASTITIYSCAGDTDNWRVEVRLVDEGGWHGDLKIYVKRTSDGSGSGTISDGLSYLEISSTDTQFFSGSGDRSNIGIQYQLTGMSINVSPKNYNTNVTFTVVDIP